MVPKTINGIRFPNFVETLSETLPKSGIKNKAKILSKAITTPEIVSETLNTSFKINGIIKSYNCQNPEIVINASPTRTVLFTLSFILSPIVKLLTFYLIHLFLHNLICHQIHRQDSMIGVFWILTLFLSL